MGQVSTTRGELSPQSSEHTGKFGTVVRALWPNKPALQLAQRIGTTERGAQYLIDGERKVTARAIAVIIAELLD